MCCSYSVWMGWRTVWKEFLSAIKEGFLEEEAPRLSEEEEGEV